MQSLYSLLTALPALAIVLLADESALLAALVRFGLALVEPQPGAEPDHV